MQKVCNTVANQTGKILFYTVHTRDRGGKEVKLFIKH